MSTNGAVEAVNNQNAVRIVTPESEVNMIELYEATVIAAAHPPVIAAKEPKAKTVKHLSKFILIIPAHCQFDHKDFSLRQIGGSSTTKPSRCDNPYTDPAGRITDVFV
jgi:hypothetical protein